MTIDVKNYDYKANEAGFLDSGIRARLVASWLVESGVGDAINLLFKVSDGQQAVSAKTRDMNNKIDVSGSYILTQQNFEKEGSQKFTLNLLVHTLGFMADDIESVNLPPEQNGMVNEVQISTKIDVSKDGVSVVKVDRISKLDLSLSTTKVATVKAKVNPLLAQCKKEPFKFEKKTAAAPGAAPTNQPPSRDMTGAATPAGEDDVPF